MTNFNTELYKALSQGVSTDDIICREIEQAVNHLLERELTVFLDYEAYDPIGYNSGNSRNGYYTRQVKTKYGEITVTVPRDRNCEFKQQTIPAYQRQTDDLETTILKLYSKGITTSEIANLMEEMYGHAYTPQTISNITQAAEEYVEAFHNRQLNKRYVVVYGDATFLSIRRDCVAKEGLHVLLGITEDGNKEVLSIGIYPHESCENYREMLKDIKERGCAEVLLFVSDGLKNLSEVFQEEFPQAKYQSCWVHIIRNVSKLIRAKDRKEVLGLLKKVYNAANLQEAQKELEEFVEAIRFKYPKVAILLQGNSNLFSFMDFPEEIRASLYTTNLLEGAHKHLKRYTKRKEQFPNEAALERFICSQMMAYNQKFSNRIHKGFGLVQNEINELFESYYP